MLVLYMVTLFAFLNDWLTSTNEQSLEHFVSVDVLVAEQSTIISPVIPESLSDSVHPVKESPVHAAHVSPASNYLEMDQCGSIWAVEAGMSASDESDSVPHHHSVLPVSLL